METTILNILLAVIIFGIGMLTGVYVTLYTFKKDGNKYNWNRERILRASMQVGEIF